MWSGQLSRPRDTNGSPNYGTFYRAVAATQLEAWLPAEPATVLDLSGHSGFAEQMVEAGHSVLHVVAPSDLPSEGGTAPADRLLRVVADTRRLDWLAAASVDAVLAESRALSFCLATEMTVADIARVLRPGGRLLLCVDSLVLGLARLAEQRRWAELADVPSADVVLVPADDGAITRCFWPEELDAVLRDVGLDVDWIRPRSVLPEVAVERALSADPGVLDTLVATEIALARERQGESIGIHLVASARRPD